METGKIVRPWKIIGVLISLIVFLAASAPSEPQGTEENAPFDASLLRIADQDPSNFLKDFAFVPDSAVVIDDRHILALYENSEKQLYALAVFNANCDSEGCTVEGLAAYSIFDARGEELRLASNLQIKSEKIRQVTL